MNSLLEVVSSVRPEIDPASFKRCAKCGVIKLRSQFPRTRANKDGLYSYCKACSTARTRADYQANIEKRRAASRRNSARQHRNGNARRARLKYLYGITPEEHDRMIAEANGRCQVCGGSNGGASLDVDHCHATGKVRGLLCHNCNLALGNAGDSPERLLALAEYLRRHEA